MSATNDQDAIYLSPEAMRTAEKIRALAELDTIEDAIRIALGGELYLQEQIAAGASLLVKNNKGQYWELDWKSRK